MPETQPTRADAMDENLPTSLDLVFGHEGGYSNRRSDRGGPTKYGITHRTLAAWRGVSAVSASEVKALTRAEAEDIYKAGYWSQCGGSILPSGLDYAVFDFGVNSGPARAVRYLQKVVGVTMDGSIGPMTLAAVRSYEDGLEKLIVDYCAARMKFLRGLSNRTTGFPANGRGWTIRVTGVDPKGEWADKPGVVGDALTMARGYETAPALTNHGLRDASSKAEPKKATPWARPETVAQLLPAAGGLGLVSTGEGPMQYALGGVLILAGLVAAWLIVRRALRAD